MTEGFGDVLVDTIKRFHERIEVLEKIKSNHKAQLVVIQKKLEKMESDMETVVSYIKSSINAK